MRPLLATLIVALALAGPAGAQPLDHLKCYKGKDAQTKASYTADLGGLVAEPGCMIKVPAAMACVPATKTNVNPPPPGGGATGTPNAFGCYKIKCPKAALPPLQLNDQFGSRVFTPKAPKLLCAPAAAPTTTTTTTTTTLPACGTHEVEFSCACGGPGSCTGTLCATNLSCPSTGHTCADIQSTCLSLCASVGCTPGTCGDPCTDCTTSQPCQ